MDNSGRPYSKHWDKNTITLPNKFGDDVKKHSHFRILFKIMTFSIYEEDKKLSQTYVSKIAGVSEDTAAEALKEIEELGYIELTKKYCPKERAPNEYRIKEMFQMKRVSRKDSPKKSDSPSPKKSDSPPRKNRSKNITIKKDNYKGSQSANASPLKNKGKEEIMVEIKSKMITYGKGEWSNIHKFLSPEAYNFIKGSWTRLFIHRNDYELSQHLKGLVG